MSELLDQLRKVSEAQREALRTQPAGGQRHRKACLDYIRLPALDLPALVAHVERLEAENKRLAEARVIDRAKHIVELDCNHDRLIECMTGCCDVCEMLKAMGMPEGADGYRQDGTDAEIYERAMAAARDAIAAESTPKQQEKPC